MPLQARVMPPRSHESRAESRETCWAARRPSRRSARWSASLLFGYLIVRWLLMVTVWITVRDDPPPGTLGADVRYAGTTLGAGASAELVVRTLTGR